jgi:hypothetical protein
MNEKIVLDDQADRLLNLSAEKEKAKEYPILTQSQLRHRREHEYAWDPTVLDAHANFTVNNTIKV